MELQIRVIDFLKENGIKKMYLASILGVYPCKLSKWLQGECNLNDSQIKIVKEFIKCKSA